LCAKTHHELASDVGLGDQHLLRQRHLLTGHLCVRHRVRD
jgi:hypothetical protein